MRLLLLLLIIIPFLASCEEKKDPHEKYQYNAFFVHPDPTIRPYYIGSVTGLSSCKYVVGNYYSKRRKLIKGEWDYKCCLRTREDECAEEHRYHDREKF